jgi:DNA primase
MEVPAADPKAAQRAEKANSLYDVMTAAQAWFVTQLLGVGGSAARGYLKQRGFTEQIIRDFGFGLAPDNRTGLKTALKQFGDPMLIEAGLLISVDGKAPYDRFRGRLMIPIRDPRGRVIAFGGRILAKVSRNISTHRTRPYSTRAVRFTISTNVLLLRVRRAA